MIYPVWMFALIACIMYIRIYRCTVTNGQAKSCSISYS